MAWWALVLVLLGLWVAAMATSHAMTGLPHVFLLAALAILLARTWQGDKPA